MKEQVNNWGPAAIIVFGYIAAAFWQNKRIDDIKLWLDAEFRHINEKLDKLDSRVKSLEESRSSGVIGSLR